MSTPNVFGASAPAAFTPQPAPAEGDYGPRLKLTAPAIVDGRAAYPPNPEYLGKALLLEGLSVNTSTYTDDSGQEKTKQVVDAAKVTVVETGEVFERQRLFQAGILRDLIPLVEQQGVRSLIARVGYYESKKRKGQFVQFESPTPEQHAKGTALVNAGTASASAAGSDAPF